MVCAIYKEPALCHPGLPFARQESECTVEEPKQCSHDKINDENPGARPQKKRKGHSNGKSEKKALKRQRAEDCNASDTSNENTRRPAERKVKAEGRVGCPYCKHEPWNHQKSACRGKGFGEMAELK
jgi:hypothetical protein